MSRLLKILQEGLRELEINLAPSQLEQLQLYGDLLKAWNVKINLTAIDDDQGIAVKHFLDSFAGGKHLQWDQAINALDLGSGPGFPGLVLKIWQPQMQIDLVDSVQKKAAFLENVIQRLQLPSAKAVHARAEELGRQQNYREFYQMVFARAVANLTTLAEYCLPFVKIGGHFYAFKGPNYEMELEQAGKAIEALGGRLNNIYEYNLPVIGDKRALIAIEKQSSTSDLYPRKNGLPAKKPLKF